MIDFPEHDLSAYRADPPADAQGPRGAVVVIQEIWGLVDHVKDVADRVAAQGYVAVAPDLLGHVGLTPEAGERLFSLMFEGTEADRLAAQPQMRAANSPACWSSRCSSASQKIRARSPSASRGRERCSPTTSRRTSGSWSARSSWRSRSPARTRST